jgi:lysozyme
MARSGSVHRVGVPPNLKLNAEIMSMTPNSRPQASLSKIEAIMRSAFSLGTPLPDVCVVGVRGYYEDSMGKPGENDRGIYDDAIFLVTKDRFASFNGNTDPSRFKHGIATLIPGVHWYHPGNHGISKPGGGYPAFRPATPDEALPVMRDGHAGKSDGIAINIHKGGYSTTSSAGCQTIHPDQWDEFHSMLTRALNVAGVRKFPYILIEGPIL